MSLNLALHWAFAMEHDAVVALLLSAGANKDIKNNKGEKPFFPKIFTEDEISKSTSMYSG